MNPSYTRKKKNSTRIWGETTASHTIHIRAFMTKMLHFSKIPPPYRLGIDSNAPFASDFHQQRKKLGGTLPLTREENNPLFILGEHTLAWCISSGSSQKSHTILEKILTSNRPKKGYECTICIIFSKHFSGRPRPPPPILQENKKTPLLDFILFSSANLKILPHHVYRRLEIWRQNYTKFLGRNQHELCKKKKYGHRIHHLLPVFKKNLWETPNPRPYWGKIKKSLLGFIWSSKAEVKIILHQVYRSFEGKNYTQFWRRNQHEFCTHKKNGSECTICIQFSKIFRGSSRAPTCRRGIHSRTLPKAALCADLVPPPLFPQQWNIWIRHCLK